MEQYHSGVNTGHPKVPNMSTSGSRQHRKGLESMPQAVYYYRKNYHEIDVSDAQGQAKHFPHRNIHWN